MSSENNPTLPPQNIEAEEAVLGSLLIDRDAVVKTAHVLTASDFYREKNGWIYEAVLDLYAHSEPADFVTIAAALEKKGRLDDCGGREYLTSVINAVPTAVHVLYYGRLVKEAALRRRMIQIAGQTAQFGYDESLDLSTAIYQVKALIADLNTTTALVTTLENDVDAYYAKLIRHAESGQDWGLRTGYPALDGIISMEAGTLHIIAGRPSQGKTALITCIAHRILRRGLGVAICSLEMSKESLVHRLLCLETGLSSHVLRQAGANDADRQLIAGSVQAVGNFPLYIDDRGTQTLDTMREFVATAVIEHNVALAIVDYLQLVSAPTSKSDGNRHQEIAAITRGLRQMGKDMHVPVVALSQLSREIERRPLTDGVLSHKLSDLRDSGAIEADADSVIFVDQPHVYNPQRFPAQLDNLGREIWPARLAVAKNRAGPIGDIDLWFRPSTVEFLEEDAHDV
jgi:replicative DNA helicase